MAAMSSAALPDAAPPVARWPRWGRPLLLAVTIILLAAPVVVSTRHPPTAVMGAILAYVYLLVPVALLGELFCARLGTERGRAPEAGTLPGLCCFALLMLAPGMSARADAPTLGLLLLGGFAVARADPPMPMYAGFGWTAAGGVFGTLSLCGGIGALGGVAALGLYAWWSVGGWRALGFVLGAAVGGAMAGGWLGWKIGAGAVGGLFHPGYADLPSTLIFVALFLLAAALGYTLRHRMLDPLPPEASVASARRVVGLLLFVALMGLPAAVSLAWRGRPVGGGTFVLLPLTAAVGMLLTIWLEVPNGPATPSGFPGATPPPQAPAPSR